MVARGYFNLLRRFGQSVGWIGGLDILRRNYQSTMMIKLNLIFCHANLFFMFIFFLQNVEPLVIIQIIESVITFVIYVRMCVYLWSMWKRQVDWNDLFERMERERDESSIHKPLRGLAEKYNRRAFLLNFGFFVLCGIFFVTITSMNFFFKASKYGLPINFHLPMISTDTKMLFWINYVYQLIVLMFAATIFMTYESIFLGLIDHSCFKIDVAVSSLDELNRLIVDQDTKQSTLKIQLSRTIKLHQDIINFNNHFQSVIKYVLMTDFSIFTFSICLCLYQSIDGSISSFYVVSLLIVLLSQLFIYCFMGNRLNIKYEELTNAIYSVKWYNMNVKNQKIILMILAMAQNMKIFHGIFAPLNMDTFQSILETSYSYLTVMRSMN